MRGIVRFLVSLGLVGPAQAHHTRDHMMLAEDAARVIAETRRGGGNELAWLFWGVLALLLVLSAIRAWGRRR
ncbi:MAG TPA: hypothetical protein ENK54_11145 [Thiotrichales bacterium]|nr:hypothetical protein [Thiotrichales bacterium]